MPIKLFRQNKGKIRKISSSYSILNLLTADNTKRMSVALAESVNHQETTKTTSDHAYYILSGKIIVNKKIIGKSKDLVYIPAKTKYTFQGTFIALLINSPAFKPENERIYLIRK